MAKNEAKIKFSAETQEFNKSISKANSEMSELRAELKLNEAQMKTNGASVEGLQEKHKILSNQLAASQDKTEALTQKVNKAVEIYGENSTEVSKLRTQLLNAQTAEEKIKHEIEKCNNELEDQKQGADKVEKSFDEMKESTDKASDGFTVMKGVAVNLITEGLNKIADAAGKVIDAFNEVDEGADNVIKATGATGKTAEGLTKSYEKVASSVVGDFGDIGSALGEVNTRFGYTGEKLEDATTDFLKFAEITGVDSTEAVQMVSRALNDAGIPLDDYGLLLDQLAKAGQTAGIDVSVLADSLSKNGATMRAMGFDTEETIALLSQFETSGADTATMLSGMKKAMANWADSGKDGSKEFGKLVEGIKNGSVDASEAIDVFGAKAGPQLVDAIKSGKFEYQDMLNVIQNSKGTTDSTFNELIDGGYNADLAIQQAKLAFAEIGDTVLTTVAPAFDEITAAIGALADGFQAAVEWGKEHKGVLIAIATAIGVVAAGIGLYNAVQAIKLAMDAAEVTTLGALIALKLQAAAATIAMIAPYVAIVAAIAAVIAIIVICVKHWDTIKAKTKEVWDKMVSTVKSGVEKVVNFFKKIFNWIKENWQGLLLLIVNPFAGAFKLAYDNCESFRNKVKAIFSKIKESTANIWNSIKSTTSKIWNGIKNAILKPIEAAKSKISGIISSIKKMFSGLKLKMPSIKLPHFGISPKGWKIGDLLKGSIPKLKISWYADGGIMTKPTIFGMNGNTIHAGGEAGPEAILPIDRLEGYIQGAIEKTVQTADLSSLASSIEALASRPIEMYINGRNVATATAGDTDSVNGLRSSFKSRGLILE